MQKLKSIFSAMLALASIQNPAAQPFAKHHKKNKNSTHVFKVTGLRKHFIKPIAKFKTYKTIFFENAFSYSRDLAKYFDNKLKPKQVRLLSERIGADLFNKLLTQ